MEVATCESILCAALPLPLESYFPCCNITMSMLRCLTVLLVAALVSDVSALPLNNCTARYQAALEEVLTIKEQCKGAAFYDCCQVRSTSKLRRHRLHSGEENGSIDTLQWLFVCKNCILPCCVPTCDFKAKEWCSNSKRMHL